MKRVHCIVEGQTEVNVFYKILHPYVFSKTGVSMIITPIKHSGGGIVKYSKLFPEIRSHVKDNSKVVTTFFDYYGILEKHNFPNYKEAKIDQKNAKIGVELLEKGIKDSLTQEGYSTNNFLPYIQLHEFEALLFSANNGFEFQFDDVRTHNELKRIRNRYETPEDINDSPVTAPSKRIIRELEKRGENYIKTVDGEAIATELGIEVMLKECPRFRWWVENLIAKILEELKA